ncbi:MAG: hypothetical protein IID41_18585 [Planctomycetes bacterium]|nr:hypothetical protein [Planctomycetota bacterium]
MAITITELNSTGSISLDQSQEVRVREIKVETTDAENDNLTFESDVLLLDGIPRIEQDWNSFGEQGSRITGDQTHAEPADIVTQGHLTVQGVRVIRLAESGSASGAKLITFRVVVQYGTQKTLWRVRSHIEITTKTETVLWDLDAMEGPPYPSPPDYLAHCETYSTIIQQPLPPGFDDWGFAAIIEGGEGIDKLAPQYVMSFQKLIYDPVQFKRRQLYDLTTTTNVASGTETFVGENRWLFLGLQGSEIREGVFDMTLKFAYDKHDHRVFKYKTEHGSEWPTIITDPNTGLRRPACRSYRVYPRADWSPIASILEIAL